MPKRARTNSIVSTVTTKRMKAAPAARGRRGAYRRRVAAGYTRTGGYYGRFTGPNKELKFFDTALSFTVDNTGEVPATGQLALIPQGDTESTRDGRMAYVKSIQIRGVATFAPGAAAVASCNGFIDVVVDTQTNGAAAAVTDVLTSNNMGTALVNIANSARFKILKRFKWSFNPAAGATTALNTVSSKFDFYKKCDIPLTFNGTTGAITELRSNNIFLLAGSDGNGDDLITVIGTCRLRFYD